MQSIRLLFLALLWISFTAVQAQSLLGTWQLGTAKSDGEGRNDCYVFQADKTFEYRVNTTSGLNRLIAIGGTYRQYKGYVELTPKYTREIVGGIIDRSHISTGNDSWSIENGTLQKKPIAKPIVQSVNLVFLNPSAFVVEDTNTFYKIK